MKFFIYILILFVYSNCVVIRNQLKLKQAQVEPLTKQLPDSNNDGFSEFSEFKEAFQNHKLSELEIKNLFEICDVQKNTRLSKQEYDDFYQIFIGPFESNCANGDYLIDNLAGCLASAEFEPIHAALQGAPVATFESKLMVDQNQVNFADYIFLRRLSKAWQKCSHFDNEHEQDLLERNQMNCAISIIVPGRKIWMKDASEIFDIAHKIKFGKNNQNKNAKMEFGQLFEISRIYYYFNLLQQPLNTGILDMRNILRNLDEYYLPNYFSKQAINSFFQTIQGIGNQNVMDFQNFAAMIRLYRIFLQHSQEFKGFIDQNEFTSILSDIDMDEDTIAFIIQEAEHNFQAYLQLNISFSEDDFLLSSFIQLKSKQAPLIQIYHTFDSSHIGRMPFQDLARFFKLSWIFKNISTKHKYYVDKQDLIVGSQIYFSPISLSYEESQTYKELMEQINEDFYCLTSFYAWFQKQQVFSDLTDSKNENRTIRQNIIKGLQRLGFDAHNYETQNENEPRILMNYKEAVLKSIKDQSNLIKQQIQEQIEAQANQ